MPEECDLRPISTTYANNTVYHIAGKFDTLIYSAEGPGTIVGMTGNDITINIKGGGNNYFKQV